MKRIFAAFALVLAGSLVYGQGADFGGIGGIGGLGGGAVGGEAGKAMAKSEDALEKMDGNIALRFFNALDRSPIPGANVEIANVGSFVTDNRGRIVFSSVADGTYTMTFSKEGFITTPINLRVVLGFVDLNWFNISPGMPNRDYRIVLEWGERPADLDLHFQKTGGSGSYHISYVNMKRAEDGNAVLDRDDMSGYGPETITIGRIDPNATYTCFVHDFTNRSSANSTQMSQSGATIRVYSQNALLKTFYITPNSRGIRWNVFKIERGALIDVNTVTAR